MLGTAAPPQQGVGLNLERMSEDSEGAGTCITYNSNLSLSISQQKQRLPIFQVLLTTLITCVWLHWRPFLQHRNEILYLLEHYQTLVIVGETGSGKTTQVPQVTWHKFLNTSYCLNLICIVPSWSWMDCTWLCCGCYSAKKSCRDNSMIPHGPQERTPNPHDYHILRLLHVLLRKEGQCSAEK